MAKYIEKLARKIAAFIEENMYKIRIFVPVNKFIV